MSQFLSHCYVSHPFLSRFCFDVGTILAHFLIFDTFWGPFWRHLGRHWGSFGEPWGVFWGCFWGASNAAKPRGVGGARNRGKRVAPGGSPGAIWEGLGSLLPPFGRHLGAILKYFGSSVVVLQVRLDFYFDKELL